MGIGHEHRFPVLPDRLEAGVGVDDVDTHSSPSQYGSQIREVAFYEQMAGFKYSLRVKGLYQMGLARDAAPIRAPRQNSPCQRVAAL